MNSSPTSWRRMLPSCYLYTLLVLFAISLRRGVDGAASGPLLGGKYQPTTDVSNIVALSEIIQAISLENDIINGTNLYQLSPLGISLQSLTYATPGNSDEKTFIDATNNPMYGIYMYSFWRSPNGSGGGPNRNTIHQSRSEMKFLNDDVGYYAHTIIMDEFDKTSGYDPSLTAETIRVTNIWMACIQSLYDSVSLCDSGTKPNVDDTNYVSPVDQAAAFWFGNLGTDQPTDVDLENSGTMYAWAEKARKNFNVLGLGKNPNLMILDGIVQLQTLLSSCWDNNDDDEEDTAKQMRMLVDDLTRYMTIPLVQNLIYHSASVATGADVGGRDAVDWVILYGLVTIPQIIICDESAYDDLYVDFITNAKGQGVSRDDLIEFVKELYSRLICVGVNCEEIGTANILSEDTASTMTTWPTCTDPVPDFNGYQSTNPSQLLNYMFMDMDVRTIGALIEMEAETAAYDVHHWGMSSSDLDGDTIAIQDIAMSPYHTKNTVGMAFGDYLTKMFPAAASTFADTHEYDSMMGVGIFESATNTQRRVITEASMVTITLHILAIDSFYKAVDSCRAGQAESTWDRGFAALSGWGEETGMASGFLMMGIAQFLCKAKPGSCNPETGESYINIALMRAIEDGKANARDLTEAACTAAEERVSEIETLLLTILVDSTAYFAQKIAADKSDKINIAEGYGIAIALVPIMHRIDETSANTVETNMANWGPTTVPLAQGTDEVFNALRSFVTMAGIDCCLLTMGDEQGINCNAGCDGEQGDLGGDSNVQDETEYVDVSPSYSPAGQPPPLSDVPYDPEEDVTSYDGPSICETGINGGYPAKVDGAPTTQLLGGAYIPTSNVDHIVKLTENLEEISNADRYSTALASYRETQDGISLQCLSTGTDWDTIIHTNPVYVIYMYGLWMSDDGDNDSDGYSNKKFDNGDILIYGDTIVMDEFNKQSGFDAELTTETVRVMNMWMAAVNEIYAAAESCRYGLNGVDIGYSKYNPVDSAAAFWFGSLQDPNLSDGGSLYAWAKRTRQDFISDFDVNDDIIDKLKGLQQSYNECKTLMGVSQEQKGIEMKHKADDIVRVMTVPMVQRFIHHLATESGLTDDQPTDERNYMVLYALANLPYISICDEEAFDDIFHDLVADIDNYDSQSFGTYLSLFQHRYECLGITCDMVGVHANGESWPECNTSDRTIAGYERTSDAPLEILKIDLDISTILSFIVMEAGDAALDLYNNGRNAKRMDGTDAPLSLKEISIPNSHPDAIAIYESFRSGGGGTDYTSVTKNAILGEGPFVLSSVLKNSAAASLSIATIDLHMTILDNMYQALSLCENYLNDPANPAGAGPVEAQAYWDSAVAATVGWSEGEEDGGSNIDGYLFFQLAQELCEHFDSCETDGQPILNKYLIEEFKFGQESLKNGSCEDAKYSVSKIEKFLQAILVDNLAYNTLMTNEFKAGSNRDDLPCLLAHVSANALVPLIRQSGNTAAADTIEANVGASSTPDCFVKEKDAVYQALNDFVAAQGIECAWLGSTVCDGTSITEDSLGYEDNGDYTIKPISDDHTMLNGEYQPITAVRNVQDISQVVDSICNSICARSDNCNSNNGAGAALDIYAEDDTAGITIEDMSLTAKLVMTDELQFNQYVFALQDSVDKTDGTFLFDNNPASEYADTIVTDAMETSIALGCRSVKVLNIWMWIVHKLNTMIDECESLDNTLNMGLQDEAAALWEGGQLYALAEELGPKFGHGQDGGMTYLNRKIVDRLVLAKDIVFRSQNKCTNADVHDLRITVKETISYMTAVLLQALIDSMISDIPGVKKAEMAELMAFAVLPHISTCGHQAVFTQLYDALITDGFDDNSLGNNKLGDTISQLQSHFNCLGLTCDDVGRHTMDTSMHPECSENLDIAGYTPANATKTNMLAKIDLDAVAIHQMMVMDRHDIAKRVYMEGHNFYDYDLESYAFVSIYNLTQSDTIDYDDFPSYSLFYEYYGSDFSHNMFVQIFDATGPFAETSASQRVLAVDEAFSCIISYMAALEALYFSVSRCGQAGTSAIDAFDGAVALLIGSVEGRGRGGSTWQEGQMFYSIGKRNCLHFHNCRGGDSDANVQLFQQLQIGQEIIQKGTQCAQAADVVQAIDNLLNAPLIQSLLYFSDARISDHEDNYAAGYVASMAVLPIVDNIQSSSAVSIQTAMDINPGSPLDENKTEAVQEALLEMFSNVKAGGVVDCALVTNSDEICQSGWSGASPVTDDGSSTVISDGDTNTPAVDDGDVVTDVPPEEVIEPEKPMPISNGLYVATNYVGDRSAIAKDVAEIKSFLSEDDADGATHTYTHGLNSKIYNENGIPTGEVRSIAKFSLEAATIMKTDPTYNLFVYGLSDKNGEFLGRPATAYADSFVSNLLLSSNREAANAMVAISIWQEAVHQLHAAHDKCKLSFLTYGRSAGGRHLDQESDPSIHIDSAAAYWIGDNQDTGSYAEGHLLYSLTEFISGKFENDMPSGAESDINTLVIGLFNKAKNHIAISRGCSTSEDSHLRLQGIIDELIPMMAVPLLRALIYYLTIDDSILVKVYATAVLPLFSACSPATYSELKDEFIDRSEIHLFEDSKSLFIEKIQSMYSCLGLTCELVGYPTIDDSSEYTCYDGELSSLAGYRYDTDQETVNLASHVDVDMRKIEIFIENGMNHFPGSQESLFGTAFDLYKYGQRPGDGNVEASLSSIARDPRKDVVPVFTDYYRYYNDDSYYADTMIVNAFQRQGVFKNASVDQRKRFIVFAMRYMVTFMAILEKIYSALYSCRKGSESSVEDGTRYLDIAVGYYVGSLEGKDDGGSFDGSLIHMLAKRMCVHFGTCTASNHARINERIISLFYAGLGEVETGACDTLERTVKEIENALIVPLLQGILFSARENERYFNNKRVGLEFYPEGFALAQSILPIIDEADQSAATNIKTVMVASFPGQDKDGQSNNSALVHRAIKKAIPRMGIDCTQVGSLDGYGFCSGDADQPLNSASAASLSLGMLLVVTGMLLFV